MSLANVHYLNDESRADYDTGGPAPAPAPKRHMTVLTDDAVERVAGLGMAALGMYTYLERRANREGIVFVSRATLGEVFGVTAERTKQVLKTLRQAGVIEPIVRYSEQSGLQLENAYRLPLHETKNPSNSRGVAGSENAETEPTQLQGGSRVNPHDSRGVGQGVGGGVASRVVPGGSIKEVERSKTPLTPQPAKAKRKPQTVATATPETFPLSEEDYVYATGKGLPRAMVDGETEKFLNRNRAKGERYKDWKAAWRNWIILAVAYGQRDGRIATSNGHVNQEEIERLITEARALSERRPDPNHPGNLGRLGVR